ncbi:MAG: murein biosynthesis integral membrane protein MurJ [Rhodospirillaceae bacterium]|nr:murein biosynthesis integral membrane protein MurJ [Rhodospirillaceae bacterium]
MVLLRSIITVSSFTFLSRIFGFIRDMLVAAYLGAGPIADACFIAFKMPNFFRRLFAEGAFNAAFVPLFSAKLTDEGKSSALHFAGAVMSIMTTFLIIFVIIFQIAMPWLMYIFAPGFADNPEKFGLAIDLTRVTFPYLLFISLVSLLGGVLNSLGRFAAVAATPIILNLILIGALLLATPYLPSAGHAFVWGVFLAGVVEFLWLVYACHREGFALYLKKPRLSPEVRRLLKLMVPGAIGAGVLQINQLVDVVIASLLSTGAISFLYYADRVHQLPLGVVGVAIGTALLPILSQQIRAGDDKSALYSMNRAIEVALLLTLPAAAALLVIGEPIVSILFERGAFDAAATLATTQALMAYSAGLPAYVFIKVLAPGFFARQDTKTPVKIAIVCVVLNLGLNLILMQIFAHVGIAMATAISAWVNAAFLFSFLRKRGQFQTDARLRNKACRIFLATLGMAGVLGVLHAAFQGFYDVGQVTRIGFLALLVLAGFVVYSILILLFRAAAINDFKSLLRRQETD